MIRNILTFIFISNYLVGFSQRHLPESQLKSIKDIEITRIESPAGYKSAYKIRVKQPLDHKNPGKGYFYQKVYLSHIDFTKPMVIITEGYECPDNRIYEITKLLGANQLEVEHRFFGESSPDSINYKYLNLEQATADLHHIQQIFNDLYKEKWISSGISKGGQTTLFYRYFYPEDVSVSIPYVAPFNLSIEDKRIYNFLDTVGSDECRNKIKAFQTLVLQKRDSILPIMLNYSYEKGFEFTYLTLEEAFEYTVLEYSFSFWQWGYNCDLIPASTASLRDIIYHLLTVIDISFFSDSDINTYSSHYYQAASEMGYYGYDISDFDTLIKSLPRNHNPLATFLPDKAAVKFDSTLVYSTYNWLETKGNNIIYIYGGSDTWSATAVPPSDSTNSIWFFIPGSNHGSARIANLPDGDKLKLETILENWLGIDVNMERLATNSSTHFKE